MLGSFLSLNSLDFKSSSNNSLHHIKIEEETESQMISETEPELAALVETDDSTRPKREKSVETDVPRPAEIVQKFETLETTERPEESSSDRRKRIRMMLLNSLAGETVTGEVDCSKLKSKLDSS